ncbi:hypothetical protein [Roseicella frigidaeris]|nr:hypothetical protein [Roseicella frigidaeris]
MPERQPPPALPAPRPPLLQRLRPWADFLQRLLVAIAAALAIWKGLR